MEWPSDAISPATIAERLDPAAITVEVVEAFLAAIPRHRELAPDLRAPLGELAESQIRLFVAAVADGRSPSADDLEPFAQAARERALQGMPLADLLYAHRLAGRIGWSAITAAVAPGEEAALAPLGALLLNHVGRISAAGAVAYLEAVQTWGTDRDRALHGLLSAVCVEGEPDAGAYAAAEALRFPIQSAYHPFVLLLLDRPPAAHEALAVDLRARHVLALAEGARVVGVAPHPVAIEPEDRHLVVTGERTPRERLAAILADLRATAPVAARSGASGTVSLAALAPSLLLARSPDVAAALRGAVLAPLAEASARRNAADLIGTLERYLDTGLDRAATARALKIHPNTLDKRLARVASLTGLDVSLAGDVARLSLALAARHVAGPNPGD